MHAKISGIFFEPNQEIDCEFTFCNFWGASEGVVLNPEMGPLLLGQILTVNENGDSCDVYYNISQDPMFVNLSEGDYHLLPNSCCIDAGDTTLTDPDGSVSDIGAYFYDQTVNSEPLPILPESPALLSNYPNPFNPSTTIQFTVDRPGLVTLTVYDMLGREVAELVNTAMSTGSYRVNWVIHEPEEI